MCYRLVTSKWVAWQMMFGCGRRSGHVVSVLPAVRPAAGAFSAALAMMLVLTGWSAVANAGSLEALRESLERLARETEGYLPPGDEPRTPTDLGADAFRWLDIEAWQGQFSVTRQSDETQSVPASGYTGGMESRQSVQSSASGMIHLQPWSDVQDGARSWIGEDTAAVRYRALAESEMILPADSATFTSYRETVGDDQGRSNARLWIDVQAGTYSVAFDSAYIPVEVTSWAEFPPETEQQMRTICASEMAVMFALVCMALREAEPKTESTTESGPGASVRDIRLPASGLALSGSELIGDTVFSWSLYPAGMEEPLRAHAGRYPPVERAAELVLDASASTGAIEQYRWTFAPGENCPAGGRCREDALKEGPNPAVILLCDTDITLTVTDGSREDSDTVSARVIAREDWETAVRTDLPEGKLQVGRHIVGEVCRAPGTVPPTESVYACQDADGQWFVSYLSGANVSARTGSGEHILDPRRKDGTWEGQGYHIGTVENPGGPFHGFHYIERYQMEVARRTLINPQLLPDAHPLPRYGINLYNKNREEGYDIDGYLEGIRRHEREHSTEMFRALRSMNPEPAEQLEELWGDDRSALRTNADAVLEAAEFQMCVASSDPLPSGTTWEGPILYPYLTSRYGFGWFEGFAGAGRYATPTLAEREAQCR